MNWEFLVWNITFHIPGMESQLSNTLFEQTFSTSFNCIILKFYHKIFNVSL